MNRKLKIALVLALIPVFIALTSFVSLATVNAVTQNCFTDVTTGMWFHDYVCWMFDAGLTAGYPDGTYRPYNNITRAEIAVMMQQLSGEGAVGPVVDADNLDGLDSADFSNASHDHFGQSWSGTSVWGLQAVTNSPGGKGVYGKATLAGNNTNVGVQGESIDGSGIVGIASGDSATNYGVYGGSNSSNGYGGLFVNTDGGTLLAANDAWGTSNLEFHVSSSGDVHAEGELSVGGYIKLGISLGPPPATDCDEVSELGRMKVDSVNNVIYICVTSGWISK